MLDCISNSPADLLANTILKETSTGLWMVSGLSGSGKTTYCAKIVIQARTAGISVGGFFCPAVYEGGEKIGIDQVDIRTEERRRLGVRAGKSGGKKVGGWQLDEQVLAWGNAIIANLGKEDLIVIDELGPLELEEESGYYEGLHLLDEKRYRMALIVIRPRLLSLARSRWAQAQIVSLGSEQI